MEYGQMMIKYRAVYRDKSGKKKSLTVYSPGTHGKVYEKLNEEQAIELVMSALKIKREDVTYIRPCR
jgi:hypothetical protein